jgi:hypothetical protein
MAVVRYGALRLPIAGLTRFRLIASRNRPNAAGWYLNLDCHALHSSIGLSFMPAHSECTGPSPHHCRSTSCRGLSAVGAAGECCIAAICMYADAAAAALDRKRRYACRNTATCLRGAMWPMYASCRLVGVRRVCAQNTPARDASITFVPCVWPRAVAVGWAC